jgi:hypothetical protein
VYVDRLVSGDATATGIAIEFQALPEHVYLPVKEDFEPLEAVESVLATTNFRYRLEPDRIVIER